MVLNEPRPTILSFVADAANIVTLLGLVCGAASLVLSATGRYPAAVVALVWACAFDWYDGLVARRQRSRTDALRAFGGQLDSLVDIVCASVGPAFLLACVSGFAPWALAVALLLVIAGALRLAYFNIYGTADGAYIGLSVDKNILAVACVALLDGPLPRPTFVIVLGATVGLLAILNVNSALRTPKQHGWWYVAFTLLVLALTTAHGVRALA